jgi:hypothetical protein
MVALGQRANGFDETSLQSPLLTALISSLSMRDRLISKLG